jgi:two-component system, cell cycle response regulator DivK
MNKRPLILVVEQNLHNLEILNFHLQTLDFSCICTKQGMRALNLAQVHKPDLILLDIMLPDMSSLELINYLRQNPETEKIPIIAITAVTSLEEQDLLFLTGADDCVVKPYNLHELEIVIRRYLNQY